MSTKTAHGAFYSPLTVEDSYQSKNAASRHAAFINFIAFIPAGIEGNDVYDIAHKDNLLHVRYAVSTSNYENKDGKRVFVQNLDAKSVCVERFAEKNTEAPF